MRRRLLLSCVASIALVAILSSLVGAEGGDEAQIRALEGRIVAATQDRDIDTIMKCYLAGPDLLVFDVAPPLQYSGSAAFRKDWESFLSIFDGPIIDENRDLKVTTDGKLAYATSIDHYLGKDKNGNPIDVTSRSTDVLRKIDGRWIIVHEHISVPVDLATGRADLVSKP